MGETVRKHSAIRGWLTLGTGVGLALAALSGPAAAGPVEDAFAAARQDVEQGRCEQAAARIRRIDGMNSRAGLLAGQCQIRAGLYPEALTNLDRVRAARDLSREQVGDVELYRGIALYHLERYAEAAAALESARGLTGEEAQLQLYTGLLLLRDGDSERAAPALEAASRLAPRLTEPVASYYAGLAWQSASERQRAREAFQRVVDLDGDGAWGMEAKKLLESTELFPSYVRGTFGIEWDDNVLLRGDVSQLRFPGDNPLTIAGEDDWRGVWEIEGGVQVWQSADGDLAAGVTASYSGSAHVDLADINTHYPTVGGYLSKRLGPNTVSQARYQFGHAWVDEQPYLQSHVAELSTSHTWTRAGTTLVIADFLANDLRFNFNDVQDGPGTPGGACVPDLGRPCGPPGIDEGRERNRDGYGVGGALRHLFLVPIADGLDEVIRELQFGGGYRFRYYDSEGEEWEYFSHVFDVILAVAMPLDLNATARFSYEHRDFLNPSTFPDSETASVQYGLSNDDRNEHEIVFQGELEKGITENWSVSGRYQFVTNDSNRDAYDYDRHIIGGYVNFRFD